MIKWKLDKGYNIYGICYDSVDIPEPTWIVYDYNEDAKKGFRYYKNSRSCYVGYNISALPPEMQHMARKMLLKVI